MATRQRIDSARIHSFVLCLEAIHILLFFLVMAGIIGWMPSSSKTSGLEWKAWVFSGGLSGIASYYVCLSRSGAVANIGLAAMLGADLIVASATVQSSLLASNVTVLGTVLMSGGVIATTYFQLRNAEEIFPTKSAQCTALFLSSLFSPLLIVGIWAVRMYFQVLGFSARGVVFDPCRIIEDSWTVLYLYTKLLLALLVTQVFWLPILTRAARTTSKPKKGSAPFVESAPVQARSPCYRVLLLLSLVITVIVSSYRVVLGYALAGDAHYYLSVLQMMDQFGMRTVLSTDRPILFLILHLLRTSTSIDAESLLRYSQIGLALAFVASTYFFTCCFLDDERIASLSALLASTSSHVTVGIGYFIISNWLGLALMMTFYGALSKSTASKAYGILAVVLSWLLLGVHFPTWGLAILVLVSYMLLSIRRPHSNPHRGACVSVKVAVGCLSPMLGALIFYFLTPEFSSTVRSAWSRAADYFTQMMPLSFALLLRDEQVLFRFLTWGCYAAPVMYVLALVGLCRIYRTRMKQARLVLVWTTFVSFGLLIIKFNHWRLLYMIPVETLAAVGFLQILLLTRFVEDSPILRGHRSSLRVPLAVGLLMGTGILTSMSASLVAVLVGFSVVGWILVQNCVPHEARLVTMIQGVLLYVLANLATALCLLT